MNHLERLRVQMAINGREMNMVLDPVNHPEPDYEPAQNELAIDELDVGEESPINNLSQSYADFYRFGAINAPFENDYIGYRQRIFIHLP